MPTPPPNNWRRLASVSVMSMFASAFVIQSLLYLYSENEEKIHEVGSIAYHKAAEEFEEYREEKSPLHGSVQIINTDKFIQEEEEPTPGILNQYGPYLSPPSVKRHLEDYIEETILTGGNAIMFDVKEGKVFFDTTSTFANDNGLVIPMYKLQEAVDTIHSYDLEAMARFVAAKDQPLASRFPDAQVRHPETDISIGTQWVDLSTDVVHDYNRALLEDVVRSGVDEVNLDYIRYTTAFPPNAIGLTGDERADRVESFIIMAREVIDRIDPSVRLGLSTFAILGWEYPINIQTLGQDVVRFAPLVDVISPMAYPQTFKVGYYYTPGKHPRSRMYYLVKRTLDGYRELLGDEAHKIRPWIQGYSVTKQNMIDQMDAVTDAGFCGFTVWNANNNYRPTFAAMQEWKLPEECRT